MPFTRRHLLQTAWVGAALGSLLDIGPQWPPVRVLAAKRSRSSTLMIASPSGSSFEHNAGPVVLMSTFLVAPHQIDNVLDGFRKQFAIMRKQPGLISAQLHCCVARSSLFMNYIVWERVDDFKRGYELPEVQAQLSSIR